MLDLCKAMCPFPDHDIISVYLTEDTIYVVLGPTSQYCMPFAIDLKSSFLEKICTFTTEGPCSTWHYMGVRENEQY
jgi:hypothetical protein